MKRDAGAREQSGVDTAYTGRVGELVASLGNQAHVWRLMKAPGFSACTGRESGMLAVHIHQDSSCNTNQGVHQQCKGRRPKPSPRNESDQPMQAGPCFSIE